MGIPKRPSRGPDQDSDLVSHARPDDFLVMATNNSSIVSKRSVERLYYPNEPHFFRFFVNKFQRRAPLINRGYHLRLHVIDITLRNFLRQPSPKTKVIVNLGCGSDVIPWQCWTRYPDDCSQSRAVFVDVDFPDLIQKKRQVVLNTPELMSHLSRVETKDNKHNVLLRSDHYYQVGCDLRHTSALQKALESIVDVRECVFMFVAEVSITYMETETADPLIHWASTIGDAEFCLLEQILPDSATHPFAQTMVAHFQKLSTPIKSVSTYLTVHQQHTRFRDRGWSTVRAQSLWSAWSDESFLTADDRRALNGLEPFDEWEEFALFAGHYLLLHATNHGNGDEVSPPSISPISQIPSTEVEVTYRPLTGQRALRRFGAAMTIADSFGRESIINCLGLGNSARLPSYDTYMDGNQASELHIQPQGGPSSRMCFTLTDLGEHGVLLVGGRSSPSRAMNDCWLFKRDSQRWKRASDLPIPLYRHSACRLADSSLVLVAGGRSAATGISDMVALYHPGQGWLKCNIEGSYQPKKVFGAILACTGRKSGHRPTFSGILAGGMSEDGIVNKCTIGWELSFDGNETPTITFSETTVVGDETVTLLSRVGAAHIQHHDLLIIAGGVGCHGVINREDDIAVFSTRGSRIQVVKRLSIPTSEGTSEIPRPLIIGSSVAFTKDGDMVIIGGAATCFSMGTFWTKGVYTLRLPDIGLATPITAISTRPIGWEFSQSGEIVQTRSENDIGGQDRPNHATEVKPIKRLTPDSNDSFEKIISEGLPVVLEGLDIGPCLGRWTLDYLTSQIGENRKVIVHESSVKNMDFTAKNFRYATMSFGDFANEIQSGKRIYLRALSTDAPADQPANLEHDFPSIAADFSLPSKLKACADNLHSSVLRISGPVNMWLHYDVQANVYCQIAGSKRLLLFPPSDVTRLSFAPGASSSSIDVFSPLTSPGLNGAHPWEANLGPGDILFIPPLWLHTATPSTDISIAVNVFFRNLNTEQYSAGRDVYGNRDLAAYEKGRQDVTRIANSFSKVPDTFKQFYMLRLAEELAEKASS